MVADFKKDCVKRNAEMLFRIHWDGDFFNEDYTQAWRSVIEEQPDIQFWVYTRVMSASLILKDLPNLSLYYSTDSDNTDNAKVLSVDHGIKLAYLADTFAMGKEQLLNLVNAKGVPCPENIDKDKEPARTLLDFSSSLNNEFSVYLKDYVEEYGISLSEQEPFGLLKYGKGQKFDKHIDNGMMFVRNVSLVYYANNTYTGGEIFFDRFNLNIKPEKNQLLIFPSNYIYSHSISEVLEGTRYSIVTWYK